MSDEVFAAYVAENGNVLARLRSRSHREEKGGRAYLSFALSRVDHEFGSRNVAFDVRVVECIYRLVQQVMVI